ncbi:MAG TPA: Yip1 family protein [Caulobacteraceae bacterium]
MEQPRSAGLVARVMGMITKPAAEWDVIEGETATVQGLFTGYVCILAAIGPIVTAVKMLMGFSELGLMSNFMPFVPHLGPVAIVGSAVISYVEALVTIFAVGFLLDAIAPSFDGQKNQVQAMKLAVYSWTAVWVAQIALIVPWLGGLVVLVALFYSLYTFWIGAPKMMKTPADKSSGYAIVCMGASLVAALLVGAVLGELNRMVFYGSVMGGGLF